MTFVQTWILENIDSFLEWFASSLKQTTLSYCQVETVDSANTLVGRDGSLISFLSLDGASFLVGQQEFQRLHEGLSLTLQNAMRREGQSVQILFSHDSEDVALLLEHILEPARATANRLNLKLDDLFAERVQVLSQYCAQEKTYMVIWTHPHALTKKQLQMATKKKMAQMKAAKIPSMRYAQGLFAGIRELREIHESLVRAVTNDLEMMQLSVKLLNAHQSLYAMRALIDPDFTSMDWQPFLPGDKIPMREKNRDNPDISELLWPSIGRQVLPRSAENLDLRTARIGDKIYAPLFIELFPKDVRTFSELFQKVLPTHVPWRISFLMQSDALKSLSFRSAVASVLRFTDSYTSLFYDAKKVLAHMETHTDDAIVKLQVCLATWAPVGKESLLRVRAAELAKAVQGWGHCEVGEISGDAFEATLCSVPGVSVTSVATASIAPVSDVSYMLPFSRPSSPWHQGALLLRSPDGKPWPYQPGSSQQTTWIDLIYARPGSGKSVLSNTLNLALCLSGGIARLPRIAIIDIGPSSSGLISLLKEALPKEKQHQVAYHRLRMTPDFSINPCDTQLGCRFPTPAERAFLVNFITLLATPIGKEVPYDGITDMAGMVVDSLFEQFSDKVNPHRYTEGMDPVVDGVLSQIQYKKDEHTTWWEITDALFQAGFVHEATLSQRYAVPLIADASSICRAPAIEDLFGKIVAPTGEPLILAFSRMLSSAVREYPILSRVTSFDLGDARVVSLDLDEVAKTGGESADRQTAVMYMLSRYVMARHYYLTIENLGDMPELYRDHHRARILEIREDPKRIIYDEFHRTSKAKAVRDQVVVDMREGRKWKVQVALLSQSLDDFDAVMVDFATSIFIMDAGPTQSIEKSARIFGLSQTAQYALRTRVHGPRAGGGTFLAQFATKNGQNTQLLTNTLGPVELWAFSTTAEDVRIRNQLYEKIGPVMARRLLAMLYPGGTIQAVVEQRLGNLKEQGGTLDGKASGTIMQQLLDEILEEYKKNPKFKS